MEYFPFYVFNISICRRCRVCSLCPCRPLWQAAPGPPNTFTAMLGKRSNAPVSKTSFCGTGHDTAINPPGSPGGCVFSLGTTWFGADVAVLSWALVGSVLKAEVLPLAGAERDLYA